MSGTMWGLIALAGIGVVVIANLLRARRTGNAGCLGHFFVSRNDMTVIEWGLNRSGIAVFVVGVIGGILV